MSVSHVQTRTNGYVEYRCSYLDMVEHTADTEKFTAEDDDLSEPYLDRGADFDSLWNKF